MGDLILVRRASSKGRRVLGVRAYLYFIPVLNILNLIIKPLNLVYNFFNSLFSLY